MINISTHALPLCAKPQTKVPSILRMILCYGLAIVLLAISLTKVRTINASRDSDRAEAAMEYWATNASKGLPAPEAITDVEHLLRQAIAIDPANPTHHDRLSQLYLWLTVVEGEGDASKRDNIIDQGADQSRQVIAALPGWALSWARLLVWKAEADTVDQEFQQALERAATLGQWQPVITQTLLSATLPLYSRLTNEDQQRVLQAGLRGLVQAPKATMPLLQQYNRLPDVCRLAQNSDTKIEPYCNPPG